MSKIKMKVPVSNLPAGYPGFFAWVKRAHPGLYSQAVARVPQAFAGMGAMGLTAPGEPTAQSQGIASKLLDTIKNLATVALPIYTQKKVLDMQLKRADAGLPPLDTSQISDMTSVKVGVDEGTRNTGLMVVGGILAAILGYKLLSR